MTAKPPFAVFLLFCVTAFVPFVSAGEGKQRTLMAIPDEVVLKTDFTRPQYTLEKSKWQPRQGTRWTIAGGILSGIPSSLEYQAKKSHHRGLEPRLSMPITPPECIARFSIRFLEGEETTIVPFVEFGHHIARLRFSQTEGVSLLVDYESLKVAEAPDFLYEPGKWMRLTVELKGDEFVARIGGGPTLYAKHPVISQPAPSGGTGLGVAGPRGGRVEIDNLTLWSVKPETQPNWEEKKASFPQFTPIQVREKPKK